MGIQALPTVLAGLAISLSGTGAGARQEHPQCVAPAALSTETTQAVQQARLVQRRIKASGLSLADIRLHLEDLGFRPSILDGYINSICSWVPVPSDTVQLALHALGLMGLSEWDGDPPPVDSTPVVSITGEVSQPGEVKFREGMTLGDLIAEAGRLKRTANLTVEVYRTIHGRTGEVLPIPEIHSIRVDSAYLRTHNPERLYGRHIPGFTSLVDRAAAFKLRPGDRVVVARVASVTLYTRRGNRR